MNTHIKSRQIGMPYWAKKPITISAVFASMLFFSGCSFSSPVSTSTSSTTAASTLLKSVDGGATFVPKMKITDKTSISGINVLTMAISPRDGNVIYLGSESNGIYVSKDAGETWAPVPFANKVYGIAFDEQNADNIYASGVFNGRGKIFKRSGEGQEWKEIYTEPSNGTFVSSLAVSPVNSQVLYAGTSEGVIIKTTDGGLTWRNLKKADNAVISIAFDKASDRHVYFGTFQSVALETKDGGDNISEITQEGSKRLSKFSVTTLVADPSLAGVIYVGSGEGVTKCSGNGQCAPLNIIASSNKFSIRAIAINPKNSAEIMYSSSKAIYKSTDGGIKWATVQLDTKKDVSVLRYDPTDTTKIYAGLRSF